MQRPETAPILQLIAALLILAPAVVTAQATEPTPHWAYSAYFGTGWYRVTGDRDVYVFRMTARWDWSEASLDADGNRKLGFYFKAPVSVGLDNFSYDDVLAAVDVENVSFLSANPGLDIEIPINSDWSLRPYVSVGYGHALGSGESAWTYWAGIKSRLVLPSGRFDWRFLSQVGFVGYTPHAGPSDMFWPVTVSLEMDSPVGSSDDPDNQMLLRWYTSYTVFGDDLEFTGNPIMNEPITDNWEIGVALGRRDTPIRIWFLKFDRLGLGYRTSSNGDLKGIRFVFRSMFDE